MRRLRQIAFAATDLAAGESALSNALGVQLCHRDPSLIMFGLRNALFPVGDQFLEIVSPTQDGTTAGRLLDKRGGDCGYMALFQVDDLEPVEERLAELGVRIVFVAETDDIRGLHLHPKDVPGAIVSIDCAAEPAEWPWAGTTWRDQVDSNAVSAIRAMTVTVDDPPAAAAIWAAVLGVEPAGSTISVDDATVRFAQAEPGGRQGITHITMTSADPTRSGTSHDLLGTIVDLVPEQP